MLKKIETYNFCIEKDYDKIQLTAHQEYLNDQSISFDIGSISELIKILQMAKEMYDDDN